MANDHAVSWLFEVGGLAGEEVDSEGAVLNVSADQGAHVLRFSLIGFGPPLSDRRVSTSFDLTKDQASQLARYLAFAVAEMGGEK